MRIYSIEQSSSSDNTFRFRSLFNECVGCWCSTKEEAAKDGDKHQKIIEAITKTDFRNIK